jgi:2-hydroxy-6-oxonona-2,4-dienedioate hydrolase
VTPTDSLWTALLGVDFCQRSYDVKGVRTRVLEAGNPNAPTLVFLHGVNGHAEAYVRNLGSHAERFRVYAIDMIGHGFSDKPLDRPYEISTYVRHVLDFLDVLGIDRVHLSGESLGGWVAARLAVDHSERLHRLVLNTPGGLNADPEVMARIRRMTMDAVSPPTREKVQKRVEWLFKDPATVPPDLVETRYRIYCQPGYREVTERILCLQDMDTRKRNMLTADDLSRIRIPTLLVWTTADPVAGLDVGRWCHSQIPDCQLVVMEHSGHWPQFEEPDLFNQHHLRFLTAS